MTKLKKIFLLSVLLLTTATIIKTPYSFSLDALTPSQMKHTVARSGIDIAMTDVTTESFKEKFTLYNTTPGFTDQYMSLKGIRIISSLNTGSEDLNDDNLINHLSIDIGSYNNIAMLAAKCPDLRLSIDATVNTVDFYGTDIGSIKIDDFEMTSFHLNLAPHTGSGLDFETGSKVRISSAEYMYSPSGSLNLSGIIMAGDIEGTPDVPSSWIGKGSFNIGNFATNNPATVDFIPDYTSDTTHPRYNSGYIAMNIPMEGSLRVENIKLGNHDFGAFAIDGFKAEKFYIEIPGRGLGKP